MAQRTQVRNVNAPRLQAEMFDTLAGVTSLFFASRVEFQFPKRRLEFPLASFAPLREILGRAAIFAAIAR
jgi:hypothetical protein